MQLLHNISLRGKIFLLFSFFGALIMAWVTLTHLYGLPSIDDGAINLATRYEQQKLAMHADNKKNMLEMWLKGCTTQLHRFISRSANDHLLDAVNQAQQSNLGVTGAVAKFNQRCAQFIQTSFPHFDNLFFISVKDDEFIASTEAIDAITNGNGQIFSALMAQIQHQPDSVVITVVHDNQNGRCCVVFGKVVHNPAAAKGATQEAASSQQPVLGIVVASSFTTNFLDNILHNVAGLGANAEVVLTAEDGTILSHPKHGYLHDKTSIWSTTTAPPREMHLGDGQVMWRGYDYRQQEVGAVMRYIDIDDQHRWTMMVKEDWAQIQHPINNIYIIILSTATGGLLALLLIAFYLARHLTRPLVQLSKTAQLVAAGDLSARAEMAGCQEELNLALVFNQMVSRMSEWRQTLESEVNRKTLSLQRTNQDLHKTQRQRTSISDINNCYLRSGNVAQTMELLIERALRFTGASAGRLRAVIEDAAGNYTFDPVTKLVSAPYLAPQQVEALESHSLVNKTWYDAQYAQVVSTNKIFTLSTGAAQIFNQAVVGEKDLVNSMMLIPVYEQNRIYAVIGLLNKPGGFTADDEIGVRAFATVAALIMAADKREQQRLAAEESTRIKGEFLATMSHELRTPMNVVIGMSSLLMDTALTLQQQDYMQKVSTSARQLLALINDILDVSKLEAGHKLTINSATFDLETVLQSVVSLHSYSLDETAVELHVDISRDVPRQLVGDSQRLEQVLSNLLGNAIKFTACGDILLQVTVEPAQEQTSANQLVITFCVKDSGIGISEQQQQHLFEPFAQGDSSITRQHGGTGLGLTISRYLCQMMGGDMAVESTLGVGSTFYFSLPFTVPASAEIAQPLLPNDDLLGIPVLVVDDNQLGRKIISKLLERMQFRVTGAETAQSAIAAVRRAQQAGDPFRLLIIDNVLPDVSGLELVAQIRTENLSAAPRILMVNMHDTIKTQLVAQDGVAAVVDKPVQASALFNTIMQVFGYAVALETAPHSCCLWRDVKLLVVEDVELNRQVVRDLLHKVGIQCAEAINGEVALEMVRHQVYDLVLMDIQMPIMDGFEATRQIRKLDNCAADNLPILAMSADALEQDRRNSCASGMNDHIAKPIDPDTLYQQLQHWLPAHKQIKISSAELSTAADAQLFSVQLPTVDTSRGLRYAGGECRQYLRNLHGFAQQLAEVISLLPEELLHDRHQALLRIHSLKGIAGTVGTTELQELARQLETELSNDKPLTALDQLLSLASELVKACAKLPPAPSNTSAGQPLAPEAKASAPRQSGSNSELLTLLEQLSPALKNLQARLCSESVAKIRQKSWPRELVNDIDKLQQLVEHYRFIQALDVVRSLTQKITSST